MDDMLHGLSLLGPRIESMAANIEKLAAEVMEQRGLLQQKAEQAETAQLRQQLGTLGHGMAQKIDQLDRDAQEFMSTTQQRINRIGDQLSEETQAVSSRVELLDERISKAVQGIERKVEAPALRRLEERMLEMDSWVETKAESSELRKAEESLQALQASVAKAAAAADLEPVRRQIKELQTSKADGTVLDQLLSKERTLTCSLAEKADFAELEQLKIQMHALSGAVAQHMESSTQDQESAQAKLSTLSGALGRCAGAEEMRDSLKDVFAELAKKAETTKLELLTSQVEILSDVLAPKLRRAHPPARPNTGPARPDGAKGRKGHKNECRPESAANCAATQ